MFFVNEIVVMIDPKLIRLMQKNRRSNDDIEFPVDEWDRISENERNRLAKRLMCVIIFLSDSEW